MVRETRLWSVVGHPNNSIRVSPPKIKPAQLKTALLSKKQDGGEIYDVGTHVRWRTLRPTSRCFKFHITNWRVRGSRTIGKLSTFYRLLQLDALSCTVSTTTSKDSWSGDTASSSCSFGHTHTDPIWSFAYAPGSKPKNFSQISAEITKIKGCKKVDTIIAAWLVDENIQRLDQSKITPKFLSTNTVLIAIDTEKWADETFLHGPLKTIPSDEALAALVGIKTCID